MKINMGASQRRYPFSQLQRGIMARIFHRESNLLTDALWEKDPLFFVIVLREK